MAIDLCPSLGRLCRFFRTNEFTFRHCCGARFSHAIEQVDRSVSSAQQSFGKTAFFAGITKALKYECLEGVTVIIELECSRTKTSTSAGHIAQSVTIK